MSRITSFNTRALAVAFLAAAALVPPIFAVNPVVVWNGVTKDFSSLQRTIGDNTYPTTIRTS